ncbi:hypothetical protein, partial [Pyramidobacter sp. C12-8]|uniref:hypothetical protein n=1 Tax=Pyramidobacter sp. C12-8 TaxID=1943580 RepID=UPI00197E8967
VKHAASVRPEPGSNSPLNPLFLTYSIFGSLSLGFSSSSSSVVKKRRRTLSSRSLSSKNGFPARNTAYINATILFCLRFHSDSFIINKNLFVFFY